MTMKLVASMMLLMATCGTCLAVAPVDEFGILEELLRQLVLPRRHSPSHFQLADGQSAGEYKLSEWNEWSECSKVCGGGDRIRTRTCNLASDHTHRVVMGRCADASMTSHSPLEELGRWLEGSDQLQEAEKGSCNSQECETSEWSDWSECSRPCGNGQQFSSRTCLDSGNQTDCHFTKIRIQYCNLQPCFRMSEWSDFASCSRECGGGVTSRRRSCVPNVSRDVSGTLYEELQRVATRMDLTSGYGAMGLFISEAKIEYYQAIEYMRTCQSDRFQSKLCNLQPCPACKGNQLYHSCKPCVRHCYRTDPLSFLRHFDSASFLARFRDQLTGCQGECQPGCGCPHLMPYLGTDGICYKMPFECPINRRSVEVVLPRLLAGRTNEFRPTPPLTSFRPTTTTAATSSLDDVTTGGEFTTAESVVETTAQAMEPKAQQNQQEEVPEPTEPSQVEQSEDAEDDNEELGECVYGLLIATRPNSTLPCRCDGVLEQAPCHASPGTTCPVVCKPKKQLRCPGNQFGSDVIKKSSSSDCSDLESCLHSSTCFSSSSEGSGSDLLCCDTQCGMKCVRGIEDPVKV